ncbi:MAG: hypothetical protein AABX47_04395 [Nanoarchaeota archaeon]
MKRKPFDHCIKENELLETGDIDKALASELLVLADHRQKFWEQIRLDDEYPSLYLEGHYEIIKELCTAILALDGWKALNHECLFVYLKSKRPEIEIDFDYLLDLKDTRNSIDYRGVKVSPDIWKQNKLRIALTINALRAYIRKRLDD